MNVSVERKTKGSNTVDWIKNNQWKLGDKIGSGSFGEVFQCMNNKGI